MGGNYLSIKLQNQSKVERVKSERLPKQTVYDSHLSNIKTTFFIFRMKILSRFKQ